MKDNSSPDKRSERRVTDIVAAVADGSLDRDVAVTLLTDICTESAASRSSLADNEIIERCAKECERIAEQAIKPHGEAAALWCRDNIRDLKSASVPAATEHTLLTGDLATQRAMHDAGTAATERTDSQTVEFKGGSKSAEEEAHFLEQQWRKP